MGRHSDTWHRQVDAAAAGNSPITALSVPNSSFPWAYLRSYTNTYLGKKKGLDAQERDARLVLLFQAHSTKDVAMAACAPAMSTECVRHLLRMKLEATSKDLTKLTAPMRLAVIAHHLNFDVLSRFEATLVKRLLFWLQLQTTSRSQSLEELYLLMKMEDAAPNLFSDALETILDSACGDFAVELESWKLDLAWTNAWAGTAWLRRLPMEFSNTSFHLTRLFNNNIKDWKCWAAWRPELVRIERWRDFRDNPQGLRPFLALEGPDFSGLELANRREALLVINNSRTTITWDSVTIKVERTDTILVNELFERLLHLLDAAPQVNLGFRTLLRNTYMHQTITLQTVHILKGVVDIQDDFVYNITGRLLAGEGGRHQFESPEIIQLISVLNSRRGQCLQASLASYIAKPVSRILEGMRLMLMAQRSNKTTSNDLETRILGFGIHLQGCSWLQHLLDISLQRQLASWPEKSLMRDLQNIRQATLQGGSGQPTASLAGFIDGYIEDRLVLQGTIDGQGKRLVETVHLIWTLTCEGDVRRSSAIALAQVLPLKLDIDMRCRLLMRVVSCPNMFIAKLDSILLKQYHDKDVACIQLARLLSSTETEVRAPWIDLLGEMFKSLNYNFIDYALANLSVDAWFQWLADLEDLFGKQRATELLRSNVPQHPDMLRWKQRMMPYRATIKQLLSLPECQLLKYNFQVGCTEPLDESLVGVLDLLRQNNNQIRPAMRGLLGLIWADISNLPQIYEALELLTSTSSSGDELCLRMLKLYDEAPEEAFRVLLAARLEAHELTASDRRVVEAMAMALSLSLRDVPKQSIILTTTWIDDEVTKLENEAKRLEGLRRALNARDRDSTTALLASLNMENSSPLEDALATLPQDLRGMIEKVSEREVELQFPLTHLKPLQRIATTVGDAHSLLVRFIPGDSGMPPGFCIHLEGKSKGPQPESPHYPWMLFDVGRMPNEAICYDEGNRISYQLARQLWRHLREGQKTLEETYRFLAKALNDQGQSCITCGNMQTTRRWRSALCVQQSCEESWHESSIEVQLADLWNDPPVVDLLLTAMYAVASSGKLDLLLPGCPCDSASGLLQTIKALRPVAEMQNPNDFYAAQTPLHQLTTGNLLSWTCSNHGGFLVSASGQLKIPNVGSAHQFVLVNAATELEKTYSKHSGSSPSVVFHGTSFDRLYAILREGLRNCSGGPLMRNGSAYGNGIYVATEPSTALQYSDRSYGQNSSSNWPGSAFHNMRVLLGCELRGSAQTPYTGIHVIAEPSTIMVRYIFLMPRNASAPLAAHIAPVMLSVFASLKIL